MNSLQPEVIKAAFVVLYDAAFVGLTSIVSCDVDARIDSLRQLIPLSRQEAQHVLSHSVENPGEMFAAAFVLAYEGTSAYRIEADFVFTQEDLFLLTTARQQARMSSKRAITLLQTYGE